MIKDARVKLWGTDIGAVTWLEDREIGVFQFDPGFLESGIQVSPLVMPLRHAPYEFPALARHTFKGLPGLLADSLPDKFGNAIINAWLAKTGKNIMEFHAVDRLCYIGNRGMGALEFEPVIHELSTDQHNLHVDKLVELANKVLNERTGLDGAFTGKDDRKVIEDILRVGTSAGGARAKVILAWNPETDEFRSGQVDVGDGFEYWLMKFDGISNNRDNELADPQGYGKIEYAYYLMAIDCGINMTACRLHHEGGRSHFMTRRFDRTLSRGKVHMQSLGAMAHYDYKEPAKYSYEQAIQVMKGLKLPQGELQQQVLRTFFNIIARNQDDHVKNIAFLMNRRGVWRLSPAFDVCYSYNPSGDWTSRHQMSVNGKRDNFTRDDLIAFAAVAGIKKKQAGEMIDQVLVSVQKWPAFAEQAELSERRMVKIKNSHRLTLSAGMVR